MSAKQKEQLLSKAKENGYVNLSEFILAQCLEHEVKNNNQKTTAGVSGEDRVYVRVTAEEKQKMIENAKLMGVTLSRYVRNSCLEKDIIIVNDLKDFTKELHKIGVNLNQIARLCNEGHIQCPDITKTQQALKAMFEELVKLKKQTRPGR